MARIGFVGVGRMGAPMAASLLRAGHTLSVFDLAPDFAGRVPGARAAGSAAEAAAGADVVITMLPDGVAARDAWLGTGGLAAAAPEASVLIDCSTIEPATARALAASCRQPMLDAPVSGGVMAAEAASLTFMVGGAEAGFAAAEPVLLAMGRRAIRCGGPGAGQAAKLCNNLLLAVSMIGTCEAFLLAERLGLSAEALFDVASTSSGQCWSLTSYCPVPGPVPSAPSNRGYAPGFAAALMQKDLALAQDAAREAGAVTPLGAQALALYQEFCARGGAERDFSAILSMLAQKPL